MCHATVDSNRSSAPVSQTLAASCPSGFPHDFALGPAETSLTGAGDRLFAVYVAPLCEAGCGPLRKFVLTVPGRIANTVRDAAAAARWVCGIDHIVILQTKTVHIS